MTATATVPRSAGNGAAMVVVALNAAISALETLERSLASVARSRNAAAVLPRKDNSLRQLYRLAASGDSVSPRVAQYLRDRA